MNTRHRLPELMDQPGLDKEAHFQALRGLRRINSVSRSGHHIWKLIEKEARGAATSTLRVLDIACGGGDIVRDLARRAKKQGLDITFDGADISQDAIEFARQQTHLEGIAANFFALDALHDMIPNDYDILICTLFLHHLDEPDAVRLMRCMAESAARLVLIDDLVRSGLGYLMAAIGCRILSRSKVVHYDGPISVSGAFRIDEARHLAQLAGLSGARIATHWPQRFLLSWNRSPLP